MQEMTVKFRDHLKARRESHPLRPFNDICVQFLDKNDCLDYKSFLHFIDDLHFNYHNDPSRIKNLFRSIDINANGAVSIQELEDFIYIPRSEGDIIDEFHRIYDEAIAHSLDTDALFARIDEDGNGFVGSSELRDYAPLIGIHLTNTECDIAMRLLDKDRDGCISRLDFDTFIKTDVLKLISDVKPSSSSAEKSNPRQKSVSPATEEFNVAYNDLAKSFRSAILKNATGINSAKQTLRVAFRALDADGDGNVTAEELRGLIQTLCQLDDLLMVESLIQQIDINGCGNYIHTVTTLMSRFLVFIFVQGRPSHFAGARVLSLATWRKEQRRYQHCI